MRAGREGWWEDAAMNGRGSVLDILVVLMVFDASER